MTLKYFFCFQILRSYQDAVKLLFSNRNVQAAQLLVVLTYGLSAYGSAKTWLLPTYILFKTCNWYLDDDAYITCLIVNSGMNFSSHVWYSMVYVSSAIERNYLPLKLKNVSMHKYFIPYVTSKTISTYTKKVILMSTCQYILFQFERLICVIRKGNWSGSLLISSSSFCPLINYNIIYEDVWLGRNPAILTMIEIRRAIKTTRIEHKYIFFILRNGRT